MTLSEELSWRGFLNQTTYPDMAALDGAPITFYWGVDPSADSMTIGNLAAAMMVKCFMKYGHQPVLLVGGATGLIGDPDGKREERQLLSPQQLEANKAAIAGQYKTVFDGQQFTLVDNYDWFKGFGYLDFLRTVGKHVPLSQMLGREFIQSRLGAGGSGISYAEFSYALIQAYDFMHLNKEYGVSLQLCGSDQWGNSIAGVDLIRRVSGQETHVYSTPLIVNKSTGVKFGKSEAGAVWLDPRKTSVSDFYQFWINTDDAGLEGYLKVFTELSPDEVTAIVAGQQTNPAGRSGQIRLAEEVTRLVHGPQAVELAQQVSLFLRGDKHVGLASDVELTELSKQIKSLTINSVEADISEALAGCGLATSKSDARRLLQNNAIYINSRQVERPTFSSADFQNSRCLLRRGKSFKDAAIITVTD